MRIMISKCLILEPFEIEHAEPGANQRLIHDVVAALQANRGGGAPRNFEIPRIAAQPRLLAWETWRERHGDVVGPAVGYFPHIDPHFTVGPLAFGEAAGFACNSAHPKC